MGIEVCGPNEVMVVTGVGLSRPKYVSAGWVFVWPGLQKVHRLSLNVMTVRVESLRVETVEGETINVRGLAQVKVFTYPDLLVRAAEHFLGKSEAEISQTVLDNLEAIQRSVISTMTMEDIYFDRKKLSSAVGEMAAPELGRLGIEIMSYTVPDVWDNTGSLNKLGKKPA